MKTREALRVKKSYVVSRKCFEFGPLLANRPQPKPAEEEGAEPEKPHVDHAELLHISNVSPFPLTVHFSFLANGAALHTPQVKPFSPPPVPDPETGETPPPDLPAARPADAPPIFFLDVPSMTLEPSETRDLRLSAFPDMDGLFEELSLIHI